jgi:hypothetical protein
MFNQFGGGAHGATKMESRGFIKMLRDCAVLNKRFNDVAADIVFTKVKDRGERFIDVHDFALALSLGRGGERHDVRRTGGADLRG